MGLNRAGSVWLQPAEAAALGAAGLAYRVDYRDEFGDSQRDATHQLLVQYGVTYLPILIWGRRRPVTAEQWAAWQRYVQHVVARYPLQRWWQLWNEPNNARVPSSYFDGNLDAWRGFLRRTARWVKEANPAARVVAGGVAVGGHGSRKITNYYSPWFRVNAVVDRVAIHTYCSNSAAAGGAINNARRVATQPVWCTELGRKSTVDGEQLQAAWYRAVRSQCKGVPLFWFDLQDVDGAFDGFGAWRRDGSHKPVWRDLTATA